MSSPPHIALVATNAADVAHRYSELIDAIAHAGAVVSVHAEGASGVTSTTLGCTWHEAPTRRDATGLRGIGQAVANGPLALLLMARWQQTRPTIVHALNVSLVPAVRSAARAANNPYVVATLDRTFEAEMVSVGRWRQRIAGPRLAAAVRGADRTIAMHAGARDSWIALGVNDTQCKLVDSGMGLRLSDFFDGPPSERMRAEARERLALPADALVVAVEAGTGESFARLAGTFPEATWIKIVDPTPVPASDEVLSADIVVSLERHVGHALVLQQAAALAVPTVSWRVPGNAEIVRHGHSGVLVRGRDLEGIEVGVRALLAPETRENAGSIARSLAARLFDRDMAVRKVLATYDELLTGETAGPARLDVGGNVVPGRDLLG